MNNVLVALHDRIQNHAKSDALMRKVDGRWESIDWRTYGEQVQKVAAALLATGVQPGDRVGLVGATRVEWVYCDVAILTARAVTVPVYPSSTPQDIAYILNHAKVKVCFVETHALWDKVKSQRDKLPAEVTFVLLEGKGDGPAGLIAADEFITRGAADPGDLVKKAADSIGSEDLATIVYTSGTTGLPKGAVLTHGNLVAECVGLRPHIGHTRGGDITLSFLPLAHIFARMLHFAGIYIGYVTAYAESMEKMVENLAEIKPTFVAAVPRLFEKIYAKIAGGLESAGGVKRSMGLWAIEVGRRVAVAKSKGEPVGATLSVQHALADKLVLSKIRARFGGKLEFFVSGGAPLSADIGLFFNSVGLEILEGYGLTETTAATHINPRGKAKLGTVGRELPGSRTRIAEDGEILLGGPMVMKGYYDDPAATAAAMVDGWLLTGDIGEIDKDGYLKITDRKKDLIITAAGKNIAPQKIENLLKTIPFVSQAMAYGDRKKFLVALLTLNIPEMQARLAREGVTLGANELMSQNAKVRAIVQVALDGKNRELASHETIKSWLLLDQDLTMEASELTPTMKLKRREVVTRYGAQLDALYEREDAAVTA